PAAAERDCCASYPCADEDDHATELRRPAELAIRGLRPERGCQIPVMDSVEVESEVLRHCERRGCHAQTPVVPEPSTADGQAVDLEYEPAVQRGERVVQGEEDGQASAYDGDVEKDAEQTDPRPIGESHG